MAESEIGPCGTRAWRTAGARSPGPAHSSARICDDGGYSRGMHTLAWPRSCRRPRSPMENNCPDPSPDRQSSGGPAAAWPCQDREHGPLSRDRGRRCPGDRRTGRFSGAERTCSAQLSTSDPCQLRFYGKQRFLVSTSAGRPTDSYRRGRGGRAARGPRRPFDLAQISNRRDADKLLLPDI
jgi:hypothetical protein